jgi:hypothetical protein
MSRASGQTPPAVSGAVSPAIMPRIATGPALCWVIAEVVLATGGVATCLRVRLHLCHQLGGMWVVLGGDRPRRTVLAVAVFLTLMSTAALIPGPRGSVSPPTMRVVPTGLQSSRRREARPGTPWILLFRSRRRRAAVFGLGRFSSPISRRQRATRSDARSATTREVPA